MACTSQKYVRIVLIFFFFFKMLALVLLLPMLVPGQEEQQQLLVEQLDHQVIVEPQVDIECQRVLQMRW